MSGPFFDLHTGGAAIDAYLTLAFPFAFGTLLLWHRTDLRVLGAVLTALGAYALFVTYSRADYAAIAVMLLMFGIGLAVTTGAGTRLVRRRAAATVAASLLLLALLPLFVGGTMERRFQAVGVDLGTRLQHWRAALALNDAVPQGALLGIGKGVFPRLYYLDQSLRGEQLATLQHLREGREDFIRFSPSGPSGVVYLQQRLAPNEPGSYRIQGRIRTRHGQDERLLLEFCERHILRFAEECQWTRLLVADTRGEWVEFNQPVSLDQLLRSGRVWQRPVDLAVLNRGLQHGLDLAALQLYSPAGEPLLANSDFAAGWDHWFFSDGNHTRWHVKNLFLFSYIEGGWLGLIVLLVFLGAVFARLWRLATHGDPLGMLLAAALAGTLTLGLFDSLFDVPRIGLSFFLLAFAGLVLDPVPAQLGLAHIAVPPWARRLRPRWVLALAVLALAALLGARLLRSDYSLAQWLQMAADRIGLGDSRLTALLLPAPRGQLAAAELQLRPHGPRIWFKELADLDAAGRRAHWNARQAEYARRGIPGFDACQAKGLLPDAGCWFVTGDVAAGERALTALRELPSTAPQASGEYGNGLELALAYDLLDGLPARQGEVATALQQRLRAQLRAYLLLLDSDGAAVWHGRSTLAAHAMLLAAVLPGTADDLALVGRAAFHFLHTIDAVALVEAWPEGYNYWINSRAFPLLLASSAYLNAFDQPPRAAAVRRVVERLGEWHIQQVRPDLVATQIGDEGPRIDLRHDTRRVIDLIAQITGRALFADFSRVLAARDANRGYYADYQWAFPLLNDPSLDSGTATAANLEIFATQLPTADWFGPGAMNQFYVRSGWDRDATFISFRAGHSLSHHGHYDAGHFTLFKGVPLAVTGASYRGQIDAGHRLGYAIRTVSKNSLLIMRPGEQVQPNHFFNNNLADGGQRLTLPTGAYIPSVHVALRQNRAARPWTLSHLGQIDLFLQPLPAVARALLRQQHVHQAQGIVTGIDTQLHQAPGIRVDGGLAQLLRVHLAQALEALDADLALELLRRDAVEHALPFAIVQGIKDLLAHVDAVQRRHGHVDMAFFDQPGEVPHEQGAQQGGDVQTVRVRVGQDADFAKAQPGEIVAARLHPDRYRDVVHLLRAQHLGRVDLPGVQNLAAQRHDGLEVLVARLLGRTACRVTLDQKQLGALGVVGDAVGQLAGQRRPLGDLFAHHLAPRPLAGLGGSDGQFGDGLAQRRVLVQPQAEGILDHPGDEGGALARGQPFLGLARELRIGQLYREDVADVVPDIVRSQLDAAWQQIAELAELAHRLGQTGAQPVDMGATLGRRDEVDVALGDRLATLGQPHDGPVGRLRIALHAANEGIVRRQGLDARQFTHQVVAQAVLVTPLVELVGPFLSEADMQPGAEYRLGAQHV